MMCLWKRTALLILVGVLFLFLTGASLRLFGVIKPSTSIGNPVETIYLEGAIMFEEIIELAKAVESLRTTGDALLCLSPCILLHVALVSDDVGVATAIIYDGNSTAGKHKYDLSAVKGGLDIRDFWPGSYFRNGIYVDIGSNVTSLTVDFIPIKQ